MPRTPSRKTPSTPTNSQQLRRSTRLSGADTGTAAAAASGTVARSAGRTTSRGTQNSRRRAATRSRGLDTDTGTAAAAGRTSSRGRVAIGAVAGGVDLAGDFDGAVVAPALPTGGGGGGGTATDGDGGTMAAVLAKVTGLEKALAEVKSENEGLKGRLSALEDRGSAAAVAEVKAEDEASESAVPPDMGAPVAETEFITVSELKYLTLISIAREVKGLKGRVDVLEEENKELKKLKVKEFQKRTKTAINETFEHVFKELNGMDKILVKLVKKYPELAANSRGSDEDGGITV